MTDDLDYLLLAFGRYQAQLDVADFDKKEGLCRIATMKQDLALLVGLNRDVGGKRIKDVFVEATLNGREEAA